MPRRIVPAPVPPGAKWCHQCASPQPLQRFELHRSKADGRAHACRRCLDAKRRQRTRIRVNLNQTFARVIYGP
jgi:hypothetical protein